jgi:nicotinamidase-related amidase
MADAGLDPKKTAVLLMDLQNEIVSRVPCDGLLERAASVARAARTAGMQVIYVQVAFREGYPEVSPRNAGFQKLKASGGLRQDSAGAQIDAAVEPQPGDLRVYKRRISAFAGSDLELILRAMGVQSLVLLGLSTSGVVLSTLRQAADLDYGLRVIEDGCADADPEVHSVLMRKVFPRQATVLTARAFIEGLDAARFA